MGGPRIESAFCYLWNHRNKKKLKKKSETEIGLEKQKAVKLFNSVSLVCSSSKIKLPPSVKMSEHQGDVTARAKVISNK